MAFFALPLGTWRIHNPFYTPRAPTTVEAKHIMNRLLTNTYLAFNLPDENEEVLVADRGFRSGDLGYRDEDGFIFIRGRIKEQYKLENGKYVVPSPIEEQLQLSGYVTNIMVCNGRFAGGGMMFAPMAKLDDGMFEVDPGTGELRFRFEPIPGGGPGRAIFDVEVGVTDGELWDTRLFVVFCDPPFGTT